MLRPSLRVGLLTLNAAANSAARLFMKHSLLTMKLLLNLILESLEFS